MKKLFYLGLAGITLFEILNVYFIMPMPGSQQMDSIPLAYFLYRSRWIFRIGFLLMTVAGARDAFAIRHKWIPILACLPALAIIYLFNFKMTADKMFLQPRTLVFAGKGEGKLNDSTVVIAVEHNGQAKGYPVRYIIYHHQVRDTLAGKPLMITYCSVCRTGRVFEPTVNGKDENFRLVGMDHFNAMFEDASTKSWWRQATGEAITGSLKGSYLPEVESSQLTAGKFFMLYPFGKIMQAEDISKASYDSLGRYEKGRSRSQLTRSDTASWQNKSWVVGIDIDKMSKAYSWKKLKEKHVINDAIGSKNIFIGLSADSQSFAVFERPTGDHLTMRNDTIVDGDHAWDFSGRAVKGSLPSLKKINAYQEFWHSWKTFHPATAKYE